MKIIEVIADAGHHDTIVGIAEQQQVEDIWLTPKNEDGRNSIRLLVSPEKRQKVLDASQTVLHNAENYDLPPIKWTPLYLRCSLFKLKGTEGLFFNDML
ncbi:MAG: hypothetical protein GQ549_00395 [Gammaproteobacteria bacterium]|nr:hypothetical protein [Gammaproteobacteria bacterium]